jgi:hypothetical protein
LDMEYDREMHRNIALHMAISSALARNAEFIIPILDMLRADVKFFQEWLKTHPEEEMDQSSGSRPAEIMLRFLLGAQQYLEAHKELCSLGDLLMSGNDDTGKYKM